MLISMYGSYRYTTVIAICIFGAIIVGVVLAAELSLRTNLLILLLGVCIGAASSVFFVRHFRKHLFTNGYAPSPFMQRFGVWVFAVPGAIAGIVLGIAAAKWGVTPVQAICLFGCVIFVVNFTVIGIYVRSLERKFGRALYMGAGGLFFDEE